MRADRYQRYLIYLGGPIILIVGTCVGFALWLQPLSHDLTRIGGYAENEFGWNDPQLRFDPPLVPFGDPLAYYDIVVFGDSFSALADVGPGEPRRDPGYWTDFVAARTDLRIGAFHRERVDFSAYLDSPAFRDHPPRLIIAEYVERNVPRLPAPQGECATPPAWSAGIPIAAHPPTVIPQAFARDRAHGISTLKPDVAIDYLVKTMMRDIVGINLTQVANKRLSRSDLFSNVRSDDILIYTESRTDAELSDEHLTQVACGLARLQARVEQSGYTAFVLMIAPERSTAYADFMPDRSGIRMPDVTERVSHTPGLHLVRVDLALKQAIAAGVRDVYLPDDTHWGSAGRKIVAETLVSYLENPAKH